MRQKPKSHLMRITLITLIAILVSIKAFAANPYAPTLQDVVVIQSVIEKDFSPRLYHSIMGEILEMKMDDSCKRIEIKKSDVICISSEGDNTPVGQLTSVNGPQQEEWIARKVKWSNKVAIKETRQRSGELQYSLVVK
jgi:hypothetical protein